MLAAQLGYAEICVHLLISGANAKLKDHEGLCAQQLPGVSATVQALLLAMQGETFEVRSFDNALEELPPDVQELVEKTLEDIAKKQEARRELLLKARHEAREKHKEEQQHNLAHSSHSDNPNNAVDSFADAANQSSQYVSLIEVMQEGRYANKIEPLVTGSEKEGTNAAAEAMNNVDKPEDDTAEGEDWTCQECGSDNP